jgi:AcrR family transcriptional regulator
MPKLSPERIAHRKRRVEDAALVLFRERGFHGVGIRDIAREAGVSLGNLYNYYPQKEAIFESILTRLYAEFGAQDSILAEYLGRSRFPDDVEEFGLAIGRMVEEHVDYLTLVYVDIAEFDGRHVRPHYEGLTARFELVMGQRFAPLRGPDGGPPAVDPAVAFTAVYMQFFNYFVVEKMIGARGHMGLGDGDAVRAMSAVFQVGLQGLFVAAPEGEER